MTTPRQSPKLSPERLVCLWITGAEVSERTQNITVSARKMFDAEGAATLAGLSEGGAEVEVIVRSYPCNKTIPVTTAPDKITPITNVVGIAKLRISTRSAFNPDFILFLLYRTWRDMIKSNCADSLCFKRTTAQVAVAGVSSAHGGGGWMVPFRLWGLLPAPWQDGLGSLLGSPARRVLRQPVQSLAISFKNQVTQVISNNGPCKPSRFCSVDAGDAENCLSLEKSRSHSDGRRSC